MQAFWVENLRWISPKRKKVAACEHQCPSAHLCTDAPQGYSRASGSNVFNTMACAQGGAVPLKRRQTSPHSDAYANGITISAKSITNLIPIKTSISTFFSYITTKTISASDKVTWKMSSWFSSSLCLVLSLSLFISTSFFLCGMALQRSW